MSLHRRAGFCLGILLLAVVPAAHAQVTFNLDSVIGAPGTNAASVAGLGNAVNATGVASNTGVTALTASGSPGPSTFDFNTGFTDSLDRAIGSTAGAGNVWADLKYDSSSTAPLVLDANLNGNFGDDAVVPGFGLHGDTFITFDLDVLRAQASLAPGTAFTLTGSVGIANTSLAPTSAAIIGDSTQLAVFDFNGPTSTFATYSITLSGSTRYLTFIGLSGLDADNFYAHLGFGNVQLQAVPEPASALLLAAGSLAFAVARRRRR